jgi:hypothetical protein
MAPGASGSSGSITTQRPDALVINWFNRTCYFLEFTRANDTEMSHLTETSAKKSNRYFELMRHYLANLPGWRGGVLPITVGIRGTIQEEEWEQNFRKLNIDKDAQDKIARTAIAAALKGLDTIFLARLARLRREPPRPLGAATGRPADDEQARGRIK